MLFFFSFSFCFFLFFFLVPTMENEDFGAISSVRSLTNVTLFAVIRVDVVKARYLPITFLESLSILLHPVCVLGG